MLKGFDNAVFFNDDIVFVNAYSVNVTFFSDDIGLAMVDLNDVSLDDDNFDNDDPEIIIHVRFMAGCNRYKQTKACKKEISKALMPVAWNLTRWWHWCISEGKKRNRIIFD